MSYEGLSVGGSSKSVVFDCSEFGCTCPLKPAKLMGVGTMNLLTLGLKHIKP